VCRADSPQWKQADFPGIAADYTGASKRLAGVLYAIVRVGDGSLLGASPSGGVFRLRGGHWTHLARSPQWASRMRAAGNVVVAVEDSRTKHGCNIFICDDSDASVVLWRSDDAGETWHKVAPYDPNPPQSVDEQVNALALDVLRPDTAYLASRRGLYRTDDGGGTWSQVLSGVTNDVTLSKHGVIVTQGTMRLTSRDGRAPFVPADPDTDSGITRVTATRGASRVYSVSVDFNGCMEAVGRSDDDGVTWKKLPTPVAMDPFSSLIAYGDDLATDCTGASHTAFEGDPNDPDHVVLGAVSAIETIDGARTWRQIDVGQPIHYDLRDALVARDFTTFATDGGLYTMSEADLSSRDVNASLAASQIYEGMSMSSDGRYVFMGLQDNGVVRYDRRSGSWQRVFANVDGAGTAVGAMGVAFAATIGANTLLKTANYGNTPFSRMDVPSPLWSFDAHPAFAYDDGDRTLYVTGLSGTWRHGPAAGNWSHIDKPAAGSISVYHDVARTLIAIGGLGEFRFSDDDGISFSTISAGHNVEVRHLAIRSLDEVYAVLRSLFGGDHVVVLRRASAMQPFTIANLTDSLDPGCVNRTNDIALHGADVLIACTSGVFIRRDAVWVAYGSGFPNVVATGIVVDPSGTVLASTYGRGLWYADSPAGTSVRK
jgi:hypothetical protein